MASNTRSSWDPFLYEMQGAVHECFASEAPYLAEVSGYGDPSRAGRITRVMDGNRTIFSGRKVRHTLILTGLQAGGWVAEEGTWNVPQSLSSVEHHSTLVDFLQPFNVTVDVERDSFDHSSANTVKTLIEQAQGAAARQENLAFLGDGTGLQGTVTDSATSLATTITGGNIDVLLPGTVWDILIRSSGADPGQGLRRKIASVSWTSDSAGTITWDTASQASDGGSGNIVHASTAGIYPAGSYGNMPGGLVAACATSGNFQDLSKTTYPGWQATDGRAGVTTTQMLSEQMLMGAVRRGRRSGANSWSFGVGDPAVIDGYTQTVFSQRRYNPESMTLASGYTGIVFSADTGGKPIPLLKDPYNKKANLVLVKKEHIQLYGDSKGPDFLQDDGSMFRRFSRTLTKEAELLDRVQQVFTQCNSLVFLNNLDVAA